MRPSSTYRVQVRPDFPLKATAEIADYLADLGVSHLYSAPLLTASPGSEHGYDVVDHTQVSPELGGADGLRALSAALKNAGLGLVVDIVPNHAGVAVAKANPTWWDVLKRGRESAYAKFYDIDWERGKILLPVLAADPGALDELKVEGDELVYYDEFHLIWQVTVGAWPLSKDRLLAYAVKAAREAATSTTWQQPDEPFETALREMVDRIYDDPDLHREVTDFAASITPPGWSNSLGQKLVQLTMPGVPDVYQGTELWDYSLVDPDNRRPVDFAARRELLGRLDDGWQPPVDETGAAKLLVVSRTLRLLRRRPELFRSYRPVFAEGRLGEHVLAFDRGGVVAVATRLPVGLSRHGGWHDTTLSLDGHSWTEVFTNTSYGGNRLAVADLLQTYPVALLVKE